MEPRFGSRSLILITGLSFGLADILLSNWHSFFIGPNALGSGLII